MSRFYAMDVHLKGIKTEAEAKHIQDVLEETLECCNPCYFNNESAFIHGTTSLCGGMLEEEYANEVAEKIWKTLGYYIEVSINAYNIDNGEDVEDVLHSDAVDEWVAQHSAIIPVRKIVNANLRDIGKNIDLIAEGRDITTVVFPDADVKIYLYASVEVRAQRRHNQGVSGLTV